jgi:DNA-binding CsgD family transcriptional regulator
MTLWERSETIAALDDLLRAAAVAGRIVLISGEAGIGKSALVQAFADRAGARARVLWGLCDPLVTPRASGPLRDIAQQVGGALAAGLRAGSSQSELYGALIDELDGPRQRPRRVVVIEDAHWADEATHDLLVFLGRRIERLPALLIVTYRDDEIGAEHPLRGTLAALPRSVVRAIQLAPLSEQCVAEQAARVGRPAGRLHRLTGGNPLLLTEMLAAQDSTIPANVRDLALARLARLSPSARDVARLVCVLPTSADAVMFDGLAEPIDECIGAGVLVPRGDGVSYRHELLRQAVEESLSPARRAALHRRALTLLSAVDDVDPARLVHHARHAGDVTALLRYAVVAAAGAAAQGAHREAVAHYRLIRPHAGRLAATERARLLEEYSVEAYLSGLSVEGMQARQAALIEREQLGDQISVGENHRWISRLAWWSGRPAEAWAEAARAVDVLEAVPPSRALAMAYSSKSQLHMLANDVAEAVAWGERARELANRLGDVDTSIHATVNMGAARLLGGDLAALGTLQMAHTTAAAAGLVDHAARALVCVATSLEQQGLSTLASAELETALEYAIANDLQGYVHYLLGIRALIRVEQCQWDAALVDADEALSRPNRLGVAVVAPLVARGRILAARGASEALSILDQAAEHAHATEELQRIAPVAIARAEYFLLADDPGRAADEARIGLDLAVAKGNLWCAGRLAYLMWLATDRPPATPIAAPYQLLIDGDWRRAAAVLADQGRRYERVGALIKGDRAAVAEGLRTLADIGADRVARWVRADLRRHGFNGVPRGPRPTTASNPAGLTARQLEVLELMAEGLTNVEIAERLTLSHRTVEHHISAVMEKLGSATRGQAVAVARRRDLLR